MSGLSYVDDKSITWNPPRILKRIKKMLKGLFENTDSVDQARIWHGTFSYKLVPGTAIRSIYNISPVTLIDAGDSYVCIFDQAEYQGNYRIIGPGEKVRTGVCKSLVTSSCKIPVEYLRREKKAPGELWELDGPMYIMHFSSSYRYI